VISLSLALFSALLALAPGGSEGVPAETAQRPENTVPAAGEVLTGKVLMDLASSLDAELPAPASVTEAVARLEAAGMILPAGIELHKPLGVDDAVALAAALGVKVSAGRPPGAVFPAALAEDLVQLLRSALVSARGPARQ